MLDLEAMKCGISQNRIYDKMLSKIKDCELLKGKIKYTYHTHENTCHYHDSNKIYKATVNKIATVQRWTNILICHFRN